MQSERVVIDRCVDMLNLMLSMEHMSEVERSEAAKRLFYISEEMRHKLHDLGYQIEVRK